MRKRKKAKYSLDRCISPVYHTIQNVSLSLCTKSLSLQKYSLPSGEKTINHVFFFVFLIKWALVRNISRPLQAAENSLYRLVNMHILMNTHDDIAQFGEDGYKKEFKNCIGKLLHTYGRLQSQNRYQCCSFTNL